MSNRFERGGFSLVCSELDSAFAYRAPAVDVGEWQSTDVRDRPEMVSHELLDCTVGLEVSGDLIQLQRVVKPNLPWAEDHFQERVCGEPLNPPPSHAWWPFRQKNNEAFTKDTRFSHTYPERFWPRMANIGGATPEGRQIFVPHVGVRYAYGDLADVVEMLKKSFLTRQAYLPVWFPEDTGAVHGERVPCTLGYHFIIRRGGDGLHRLHCVYYIRSCDYMRHFRDDVYMAARLMQWVACQVDLQPGRLTMHITSFHVFAGDIPILKMRSDDDDDDYAAI